MLTSSRVAPRARPRACAFGPLEVHYDDRVLEPRPWTVAQSRWAAELSASLPDGPILELCAGAGQIGLLSALLTGRRLVQVEADAVAAGYADDNVGRAGLDGRVEIRVGPMDEVLRPAERFPLVIADPPYLRSSDLVRWPADPPSAVDGGEDGLALVRTCLRVIAAHLAPGGAAVLQLGGPGQVAQVEASLAGLQPARLGASERRIVDDERALLLLTR